MPSQPANGCWGEDSNLEAERLTPTLRALVPTRAFGSLVFEFLGSFGYFWAAFLLVALPTHLLLIQDARALFSNLWRKLLRPRPCKQRTVESQWLLGPSQRRRAGKRARLFARIR